MGLHWFKLIGIGLGVAVIAAVLWAAGDRFVLAGKLEDMRSDKRACIAAAIDSTKPPEQCGMELALVVRQRHEAIACDAGLSVPRDQGAFIVANSCSEPVKRLFADRDARAAEAQSLRDAVREVEEGRAAAVGRAEARGRAQTQRKERADDAIQSAPGGPNGRRCDAECLRRLG